MEEITDKHHDLFEEKNTEEIPIYRVKTRELSLGNSILAYYRKKIIGKSIGAEYRPKTSWGEEQIKIVEDLPSKLEKEILKHEVNHLANKEETNEIMDKYLRIAGTGLATVLILSYAGVITNPLAKYLSWGSIASFFVAFKVARNKSEDKADEDVDISSVLREEGLVEREFGKVSGLFLGVFEKVLAFAAALIDIFYVSLKSGHYYIKKIFKLAR